MIEYIRERLAQFAAWSSWHAWNYARNREIMRKQWRGESVQSLRDDTPEKRRIRSNEARQLLDNEHFKEAFGAVERKIEEKAQTCDPDNIAQAQRIVISKQILHDIRRQIIRKLEDGYMAEIELQEIEQKKRGRSFVR